MLLSFVLVVTGFAMQFFMISFFPGCVPIVLGNLFLIVKGYDNRVKTGKFKPSATWEKVDKSKFMEVEKLHQAMKRWDRSMLDISNGLGGISLAVIAAGIGHVFLVAETWLENSLFIISYDAALLLIPHWVTGIRSILTKPNLLLKTQSFKTLLDDRNRPWLAGHETDYYMLMDGDAAKIPDDVKIRINVKHQHKDFLGLYGQIVTNDVNGTAYPYFYVVLVARQGFGLENVFRTYTPPNKVTKEFKTEKDVEILVIRQATTRTSGYHTNNKQMLAILKAGVMLADQVAVKK